MKVSHMRNFSTCKDTMKQINFDQKMLLLRSESRRLSTDAENSTDAEVLMSTDADSGIVGSLFESVVELGRYVATERASSRSLRSDRAKHAFGRCIATLFELMSDVSCFLRKAFRKEESILKKYLSKKVEPSNDLFTFVDCSQGNSGGIVRDLEVQIGNALVQDDFHVMDIKLSWNSSLLLGRAFLSTVGAVCNLQSNQLCLTLIDPHTHYDPIPVKKSQPSSRRINDPGINAPCHCGVEYETEYSASIETHTATSIDSGHQKSTDTLQEVGR
ncbi:hypothetical protein F2Q68_00034307 [Brassica cretica]|uniref:Uncharacterized protein n=1 Tax=Brassica cretica TaxID=69181 RepID=A0A8S9H567_BRACR|nr:hypothetical protein F2Q68_00034307 [Brassica cretica]